MDTHIDAATLTGLDFQFWYLAPGTDHPHNYTYDPPPGVERSNAVYEPHRMHIRNARPIAADLSLDNQGFALVRQTSAVRDFYNEDELRQTYYPEAERLVAEATGAARVIVFDHTLRRRIWGAEDRTAGTPRQPVARVHNDYTEKSAPQRVRDLMGAEAEALLQRRYEIVNVWRPITGPLRDAPSASVTPQRRAVRLGALRTDLPRPPGGDLCGPLQSGASLVLCAGHDAG